MKELTQWWAEISGAAQPWLILGKGPTFSRRGDYDLTGYKVIALNHVIRELKADVASAIDVDVVRDCAEEIRQNARVLLMPRYPHLNNEPSDRTLESFFDELPVLRTLSDEGRLVWYNLSSGPDLAESPRILTGFFSAEVMINLLGTLGATKIRSLGVDGGTAYSSGFGDLERTRLANGQPSFNMQFQGIADAINRWKIDYAPLATESPIRIFIGADESQLLGARVLEYSVRKFCPMTCVFDTMQNVNPPMPRDPKNQPRTQFSFRRFAIPALAGFKGRAVYLDADMQVFRSFQELWDLPFDGATVLYAPSSSPQRPSQFSVLLLDCDRLRWDVDEIVRGLDEGRYDYDGLMKELCIEPEGAVKAGIPPQWNSLEEYHEGKTGLIHYTDMPTQPWVSNANPNGDLWVLCLRSAVREGFISWEEVRLAVRDGFARPSLYWQLKVPRRLWPRFRPVARLLDMRFKPHQALQKRLARAAK